jgi:hypothetical protein
MGTKYRCDLLDMDRIAAMQLIEAENDSAALREADKMLSSSPCTAVEVWDRNRKVSILSRKTSAA